MDHVGSSSTLGRIQSEGNNMRACTKQLSYINCLYRCPMHICFCALKLLSTFGHFQGGGFCV